MSYFSEVLKEPLPSHQKHFVESVENEYARIDIYYEEYTDLFTLYIEKSHQTKEEKKKQQELLKKLNYDPKTKTIEVDGHKTGFRIDREDPDNASHSTGYLKKSESKTLDKYNEGNALKRTKMLKDEKFKNITNKLEGKHKYSGDHYTRRYKLSTPKAGTTKSGTVRIGKNKLNEDMILHEVGHSRDLSNRRRAEAEPSYVAKYGTKELSKEARRARLELNRLNKMPRREARKIPDFEKKCRELEKTVQKGIEQTPSYRKDKRQQRRDAIEKMDKNLKRQVDESWELGSHDRYAGEYYADAYAMKHSSTKGKKLYKDMKKRYGKIENEAYTKGNGRLYNAAKEAKESTEKREKIARGAYRKYGKTAIESAE